MELDRLYSVSEAAKLLGGQAALDQCFASLEMKSGSSRLVGRTFSTRLRSLDTLP
jgi:hypothetical protein